MKLPLITLKLSNSQLNPIIITVAIYPQFLNHKIVPATTVLIHGLTLQFITSESFSYYTVILGQGPCAPPATSGVFIASWRASNAGLECHFSLSDWIIPGINCQDLGPRAANSEILKLAYSMFISEWDWSQHLGRDGRYPQREKLGGGAALRMTWSTPWGALESRYQWELSCVGVEHVGLYLPYWCDIEYRFPGKRIVNLELWVWRKLYPQGKEIVFDSWGEISVPITTSISEASLLSKVSSTDIK